MNMMGGGKGKSVKSVPVHKRKARGMLHTYYILTVLIFLLARYEKPDYRAPLFQKQKGARRVKPGGKALCDSNCDSLLRSVVQALREIRHYQRAIGLLIPKAPFARCVREVILEHCNQPEFRIQASALTALQEACEAELIRHFEGNYSIPAFTITYTNTSISGQSLRDSWQARHNPGQGLCTY